jgi:predicted dehydrogenase
MRQVIHHLDSGETTVAEGPAPAQRPGHLLIQTRTSLISSGTERMLVEFGQANLLEKARQQPDKVKAVLDKARSDGMLATLEAVRAKLREPIPLGYCNVGTVLHIGAGVEGFALGDRVASNGPHAEVVRVAAHLCARVPASVADDEAVFAVAGSIALQGIRLIAPTLGETIVVTGLGLIGLLAVQILRANGCTVIGIDLDDSRVALAAQFGADTVGASTPDKIAAVLALTAGRGVDAVLICASTDSDRPISDAAGMCRQRGRIVLVGTAGLTLARADFYAKELSFQVSCSYGPGRHDPQYEEQGRDYPFGFVRWTEQRNIGAVLALMASGGLRTSALVTHRMPIARATDAYALLARRLGALAILLDYDAAPAGELHSTTVAIRPPKRGSTDRIACTFIGAGNYAFRVLIPEFGRQGARLHTVVTTGSIHGIAAAKKFGFEQVSTDVDAVFRNADIDAVVVATRHDSHADFVVRAIEARKHLFVEKPLAITRQQLERIRAALAAAGAERPVVTVGFNRRYAPLTRRLRGLLANQKSPRAYIYTVNSGAMVGDHWTQDRAASGGRILGEACHFIDLLRYLAASPVTGVQVQALDGARGGKPPDTATVTLSFASGDIGTIHYYANGARSFPKERLEVFSGGGVLRLDNFRQLASFGWPGFASTRNWKQDKGQQDFVAAFLGAIAGRNTDPIPIDELLEVAEVSIRCAELLEPHQNDG